MACVQYANSCFTAGETITIDWQYTEDDKITPIDLTGATAEMQLLESLNSVNKTIAMTGGITTALNGEGRFSLTKVESQTLLPIPTTAGEDADKKYVGQIKITFLDTTVDFIGGLNVNIEQNAIR